MPKPATYLDFDEFYHSVNAPDSAQQLRDLYESVENVSEETYYTTRAVKRGTISYIVIGPTGEQLFLTDKSRAAFIEYIKTQHRNEEPELDIDEAAEHEYRMNDPRA